jgi:hypothetical protein
MRGDTKVDWQRPTPLPCWCASVRLAVFRNLELGQSHLSRLDASWPPGTTRRTVAETRRRGVGSDRCDLLLCACKRRCLLAAYAQPKPPVKARHRNIPRSCGRPLAKDVNLLKASLSLSAAHLANSHRRDRRSVQAHPCQLLHNFAKLAWLALDKFPRAWNVGDIAVGDLRSLSRCDCAKAAS